MNLARAVALVATVLALVLALAGCQKTSGDPTWISRPADSPSGLAIVTGQPSTSLADVGGLVAGSARTGEHLAIISGSGKILSSAVAPPPPAVASPAAPPSVPADPTQFQVDAHQRQEQAYQAHLAADQRSLARLLASRRSSWATTATGTAARAVSDSGDGSGLQPGIWAGTSYFTSLQQAGVNLGTRRVLVIFGVQSLPGGARPLPPGSLTGITVIIANFQGTLRGQQEWQADLLQADAARVIVLVPAAEGELTAVTEQGLAGQQAPAPVDVHFGLNQASLQPAARTLLARIAVELTTTYPTAVVTILGFADPLGTSGRNIALSTERALACKAFLIHDGVAAARIFATGYGTDLPAAPSEANGTQPLDRRAIIVIDPVS